MKRPFFVSFCLLLIIIIGSCGKTTCLDPGVRITFKGFDTAELSRVLITQYLSNTGFASPITVRFMDTAYTGIEQSHDTIYMAPIDTSGIFVAPGYDYLVEVPASNKTYAITRISFTARKLASSKNGKGGCTNDANYYLDSMPNKTAGQLFATAKVPPVNIVLNK